MISFLGPPHDIHLASAIRTGLVIAWWLMPIAFLLCAVHFARKGDRRGRRMLVWYVLAILGGVLLSSAASLLAGTYAPHGRPGFASALVATGRCLFAPDTFCAWPEMQLVIVPGIYLLLLYLVISRRRPGGGQVQ